MIKNIYKNKVFNNATWIIICKIIKALLTFLVTALTARILGPSDYGLINYAIGLVAFFVPIMKLGFDGILVYEYVNKKELSGEITGTAIVLNLISSLLCILGVFIVAFLLNYGNTLTITICVLYSVILVFQALELIQYWFQANLLSKIPAFATVISYIIVAIMQILIIYLKLPLWLYALSSSLEYAVMFLILFYYYIRNSQCKLTFSKSMAKTLLSSGKYYIISGLMITVYNQVDRIMLNQLLDDYAVGIYSAATVCSSMFSFVFIAIIDSCRPMLLDKNAKFSTFNTRIRYLYSFIIYSSLVVSICVYVLSPLIINIMYGNNYFDSTLVLRILIWFTMFSYLGTIRDIWLLFNNKKQYILWINLSGAILNVMLNFALIRTLGVVGAAVASLITQIFINLFLTYIIKPLRDNFYIIIKSLNFFPLIKLIRQGKENR